MSTAVVLYHTGSSSYFKCVSFKITGKLVAGSNERALRENDAQRLFMISDTPILHFAMLSPRPHEYFMGGMCLTHVCALEYLSDIFIHR